MRHAELVKRIAYHLAGRLPASVEVADLIQAGMLGLLEAASNYTADRGASFETYAGIRIRGAMLDATAQARLGAALGASQGARGRGGGARDRSGIRARSARRRDRRAHGRVARGVSQDRAGRGELPDREPGRCEAARDRCSDGSRTRRDPFLDATDEGFRAALAEAIKELPERERLVMSLYYDDELNLKEIGAVLKVTESRVCQLHGQALVRLKARLVGLARSRGDDRAEDR